MFKAISWGQYAGVLFLLLLAYYAYVGLAYYRVELLGLLKNKGKAPGPDLAPAPLRSPAGKRSLIAKAASTMPATFPEVAGPAAPNEETQAEENEVDKKLPAEPSHQEEQAADEQPGPVVELPPLNLPTVEVNEMINYDNSTENSFFNDNSINFTEQNGSNTFQDTKSGMESASNDFYLGSTIGIAQLGNYLGRAAEGQVTPEQLVEQEPGLANTELLLAFFQDSTKNAQRATAHLYAGVAEPVLD